MLSAGGRPANSLVTCNFSLLLGQQTNPAPLEVLGNAAGVKKTEKNYLTNLALQSSCHVVFVEIKENMIKI